MWVRKHCKIEDETKENKSKEEEKKTQIHISQWNAMRVLFWIDVRVLSFIRKDSLFCLLFYGMYGFGSLECDNDHQV